MRVRGWRPAVYTVAVSSAGIFLAAIMSALPAPWSWWRVCAGLLVGYHCCVLTFGLVGPAGLLRGGDDR